MKEIFTQEEKEPLLKVKSYYDKIGTISGVAEVLGMQPWRVKKCLRKGHYYGLFVVDKFNKKPDSKRNKKLLIANPNKVIKYQGYKYSMKDLIRLFKKYGFLPYVARVTGIPSANLRYILVKEFDMGLFELRQKLGIRKSCLKRRALDKHLSRCQQVKETYDRLGTLEKAGKELGITRERVRQILSRGEQLGIFEIKRARDRLKRLKKELTKEILVEDIKLLCSQTKICLKYNISEKELKFLLRFFSIDLEEYKRATRAGKYIQGYSKIVDELGYHPATTELNSRPNWRKIWVGICRYWGNIDNFRKEFAIEKPKRKIPPKFRKRLEKLQRVSLYRKNRIIGLIKEKGSVNSQYITASLGINQGLTNKYLLELQKSGLIVKKGTSGKNVKYSTA